MGSTRAVGGEDSGDASENGSIAGVIVFEAGVATGDEVAFVSAHDAVSDEAFVVGDQDNVTGGIVGLRGNFDEVAISDGGEHTASVGAEADGVSAIE